MQIIPDPDLASRTTLGLGGQAVAEICLEQERDCEDLRKIMQQEGGSPLALGQGSNLLFGSGKLDLLLIRSKLGSWSCTEAPGGQVLVRAGAELRLPFVLNQMLRQGMAGLEGLVGVPASLGGAVAMNAGAFGQEMQQVLHRVQLWSMEQGLIWLEKEDLQLEYRHFKPRGLKGFWMLLQVEMLLQPSTRDSIKSRMRANYMQKKASQPLLTKTCGCVFKNPACGPPAGYLLEKSGLKGYRLGGLAFSEQHANFLIHLSGGSSGQALELIDLAQKQVRKGFGLDLQLELCILDKGTGRIT